MKSSSTRVRLEWCGNICESALLICSVNQRVHIIIFEPFNPIPQFFIADYSQRLPLLTFFPSLVKHAVRNQEVFLEKILCEIVESLVIGSEPVGGRDARDACEFVHVLRNREQGGLERKR